MKAEMIVDAHAHVGFDEVFDKDFSETELISSQQENGIDVTLVQPGTSHDLGTVQGYHDRIASMCQGYPGRFFGIANPSPHLPDGQYEQEIDRCIAKLGFVGIKLHPMAHAVNPTGTHGLRVFGTAGELGVPVMVHTGTGIPWSAPASLDPIARQFPGLKIVLAHAGMCIFPNQAADMAERYPNVYLECSWISCAQVRAWVTRLGPEKLMFGSDHADNAGLELSKLRLACSDREQLDRILGRTALNVFGLTART